MDADTILTNLNSLKEIILDEERLVTYVSVSKEFCLHVNESKSLLKNVVEEIRKTQPDIQLNINILVSGVMDNGEASTSVCTEKDYMDIQHKFKDLFFSHIYSINKGRPSVDSVSLMAVNKFEDLLLCPGLVKNKLCEKHTSDEIEHLKGKGQTTNIAEQKPNKLKSTIKQESLSSSSSSNGQIKSLKETKLVSIIKTELPSPTKDITTNSKYDSKVNSKMQKGVAGFFNKANSLPSKNFSNDSASQKEHSVDISKEMKISNKPKNEKNEEMDVDEVIVTATIDKVVKMESVKNNISHSNTKQKSTATEKVAKMESVNNGVANGSKQKKTTSVKQIKKNAKVEIKRKRVLHVSDSESEDESNDPFREEPAVEKDSDDEIPPTPSVSTVKITSGIINPKKRRKIVDKTYTDKDGYILTKKEEVLESCSENEDDINTKENVKQINQVKLASPEKKNGNKVAKKKISPPQKGKQATLMNFFKKV